MLVKITMRCYYAPIRRVTILKDSPCQVVARVWHSHRHGNWCSRFGEPLGDLFQSSRTPTVYARPLALVPPDLELVHPPT